MTHLASVALFGIVLVITFYGWGSLLEDILRRWNPPSRSMPRGALGLATVLAIGGVFNIATLLTAPVYIVILLIGLAYAGVGISRECRAKSLDWRWLAIVLVVALLTLRDYLASLHFLNFNVHDDCYSYLVMAVRILQAGTLRPDPFNFRSMISGPGGMAFLQAPVIGLFGVNAARLVDAGAGLLLFIATCATFMRRFKLSAPVAIVLLGGSLVLAQHQLVNITSYFTTLTLLVALFHVLSDVEDDSPAKPIRAALLVAGIIALKEVAVFVALALCTLAVIGAWRRRRPHVLRNALIAAAVLGLPAIVWFLPRLQTHAQLISLTRGDGPDEVSVAYMIRWIAADARNWAYLVAFIVSTIAGMWIARRRKDDRIAILSAAVAVIVGGMVMTYLTGGAAITRYNQPLFLVGYLVCGTIFLANLRARAAVAVTAIVLGAGFLVFRDTLPPNPFAAYADSIEAVNLDPSITFPPLARVDAARRAQAAMIPGAAALARTDYPFLFDFARNPMYVSDLPGAASLPPGMPYDSDLAMVQYLRSHSIRYLIYAYGNEANFSAVDVQLRLAGTTLTPWQRAWHHAIPVVQARFRSVASHWPNVYDDGHTVVVDVSDSAPDAGAER